VLSNLSLLVLCPTLFIVLALSENPVQQATFLLARHVSAAKSRDFRIVNDELTETTDVVENNLEKLRSHT
jgi:hypothetical protein